MADVKISELPSATPALADLFALVHGGVTSRATLAALQALLTTNLSNALFVDPGTTVALGDQTGGIATPFSTAQGGLTAGSALSADATLLLCSGDYSSEGALTLPAFAHALAIHGLGEATSATSIASLACDAGDTSPLELRCVNVSGNISRAAGAVYLFEQGVGGTITAASVNTRGCSVAGLITVTDIATFDDTAIISESGTVVTTSGVQLEFRNGCRFSPSSNPVLEFTGAAGTVTMDRATLVSFVAAGGTVTNGSVTCSEQNRYLAGITLPITIGGNDLSTVANGSFASVATGGSFRGFIGYQVTSDSNGALVSLFKARGTTVSLSVPVDNDTFSRIRTNAWDGSSWATAAQLQFEAAAEYGTTSGTLPATIGFLSTSGPSFAANFLGSSISSALRVPLSHSRYAHVTLLNAAPTIAVDATTPIDADTSTMLGAHFVGRDQTTGDMYHRMVSFGVKRVSTGTPVLYAVAGSDVTLVADDGTWAVTWAVNAGTNSVEFTITSDATNNVKWSVFVWVMAIPFPPG